MSMVSVVEWEVGEGLTLTVILQIHQLIIPTYPGVVQPVTPATVATVALVLCTVTPTEAVQDQVVVALVAMVILDKATVAFIEQDVRVVE